MAENRTINIDINQNAEEATKDFNELNKSIKDTQKTAESGKGIDKFNTKLDELDKKLASGTLTTREMNKLMKEYQTVATQAGTQTPVGDRAIKSAALLKDTLADLSARTKLLSSDYVKMDTTLAAIGTGAQVFSGITSAMALTGIESEELQKTMVKLQAVQGVANSISAVTNALNKDAILGIQSRVLWEKAQAKVIGQSTGSLKGFKVALASTGIGLIVVAIGLLVENFDKLLGVFQPVIDGLKAIGDAIGLTDFAGEEAAAKEKKRREKEAADIKRQIELKQRAFDEEQKAIQRTIDLYNAQGKDVEKLTRLKLENAAKVKKALLDEQKQLISNTEYYAGYGTDLQKNIAQANQDLLAQSVQEAKDTQSQLDVFNAEQEKKRKDKAKENAKERADNNKNLLKQIEDAQIEAIQNEDIKARAKLLKDAERSTQEINKLKADEKKKATLKKLIDEKLQRDLQALDDKRLREEQEAIKAANSFRIQQERELAKTIEDIAEQNYQRTLTEQEKEILAVNDKYFELETLAQGNADALNEIELAKLNELNDINLKYDEEDKARKDAKDAEDKERRKRNRDFAVEMTLSGLNTISSLTELFGKKSEKAAKRAFQINKAAQIASATITTYKSATDAYASQFVPIPDATSPIRGGIAAGVAVAAGLANIAKIASQKFEGGGSSGGGGGTSAGGGGTESFAPQFNVIGNSGINQLAQLTQQPVQAYVVSGEVTSAQALDRNRQKNATL